MTRAAQIILHDHSYIHDQGEASNQWVINHNLNRRPSITVVDSGNTVVHGNYNYLNNNTIILTFNAPFKGKAYLN